MNTTATWIGQKVSDLLAPGKRKGASDKATSPLKDAIAPVNADLLATNKRANDAADVKPATADSKRQTPSNVTACASATSSKTTVPAARTTAQRLAGKLKHKDEAHSTRELRRLLEQLKAIVDPQLSEVEGGRLAEQVVRAYAAMSAPERRDLWLLMSEQFVADRRVMEEAQGQYAASVGTADEAAAEVRLRRSTVSPRRRLLQRFSAYPQGIRFLVDVRAEMLQPLKAEPRLRALDVEMEYMFSTWFDVGFLDLCRLSWDSPASLIEKLIKYEAVHDIKSWADVKNRLDSDRRCYGFFHPRLPDEPLIFVEVALMGSMATSVTPLLDESADVGDIQTATTAVFYSISNTQTGLRGVSFGDSLIKRVVETLKAEFPKLKVFVTLSPIPGFRNWLQKNADTALALLSESDRAALAKAMGQPAQARNAKDSAVDAAAFLIAAQACVTLPADVGQRQMPNPVVRQVLMQFAAHYLGNPGKDGKPLDPVARFHLGNGARLERLNWAGDPSPKGLAQSYGLMVNYLYDLKRLEKHRAQLAQGKIAMSSEIQKLQ